MAASGTIASEKNCEIENPKMSPRSSGETVVEDL
jgi:hypothetical protein